MPEPVAESSRRFIEGVHPDDRPLVRAALAEAMEGRPFDIEFRWSIATAASTGCRHAARHGSTSPGPPTPSSACWWTSRRGSSRKPRFRSSAARSRTLGRACAIAGELSIALAHELRQPLAAISRQRQSGPAAARAGSPNLRSDAGHPSATSRADDARAADVITRLRALMRNDAVSREPLDVNTVVREALLIARPGHRRAAGVAGAPVRGRTCAADCRHRLDPVAAGPAESLVINGCEAMESAPAKGRRLAVPTAGGGGRKASTSRWPDAG